MGTERERCTREKRPYADIETYETAVQNLLNEITGRIARDEIDSPET